MEGIAGHVYDPEKFPLSDYRLHYLTDVLGQYDGANYLLEQRVV